MPKAKYVRDRDEVQRKFPFGCQIRHKETGAIYTMGKQRDVYSATLVQLNPMGYTAMRWRNILEDFERASV